VLLSSVSHGLLDSNIAKIYCKSFFLTFNLNMITTADTLLTAQVEFFCVKNALQGDKYSYNYIN